MLLCFPLVVDLDVSTSSRLDWKTHLHNDLRYSVLSILTTDINTSTEKTTDITH